MVSANTLCKKLLNVKNAVVEGADFYTDADGVNHIQIHARPNHWHKDDCPFCHKRCPRYDKKNPLPRIWRALDWGGTLVEVSCDTHRIQCPEHGIVVADVPWAYPNSGSVSARRNRSSEAVKYFFQRFGFEFLTLLKERRRRR